MAQSEKIGMIKTLVNLGINIEGAAFNIPCPVCLSERPKNKTLHIDTEQSVFRCPRCESSGSEIHFYGLMKYGYTKEYIKENKDVFVKLLKELKGKATDLKGTEFKQPVFEKKDVPPNSIEERGKTYEAFLKKIQLSDTHYNNLIDRGLRESDIFENGYASTPKMGFAKIPSELRKEACDLLGVPGFYKKNETWTLLRTNSGFFIPARDISINRDSSLQNRFGYIQAMQIRYDTIDDDDVRYKWWSTKDFESGCAALTYPHFVGYPEKEIILTEGPLKGDIIYRFSNTPVIAIPGVGSISNLPPFLELLWKLGVRVIDTAFDMDYVDNINVQDSYIKLVLMLMEYGFIVKRLLWDKKYKGYDDFLLKVYLQNGGKLGTKK